MSAQLLPCPHCGLDGHVEIHGSILRCRQVKCETCGSFGPCKPNDAEAMAAWNRRTPANPPDQQSDRDGAPTSAANSLPGESVTDGPGISDLAEENEAYSNRWLPKPAAPQQVDPEVVKSERDRLDELINDPEWCAKWNAGEDFERPFWTMVQALRADEGDSITLLSDNPDGPPNNAIECCGAWTDWVDKRFSGETLRAAVMAAYQARALLASIQLVGGKDMGSSQEPSPSAGGAGPDAERKG